MQAKLRHADPEVARIAVSGITEHRANWHALGQRLTDLPACDRRLGREVDLLWHASLGAPRRVLRPGLGKVER